MARNTLFADIHAASLTSIVSDPVTARAGQPAIDKLYVVTVDGQAFTFTDAADADTFAIVAGGRLFARNVNAYVISPTSVTTLDEAIAALR